METKHTPASLCVINYLMGLQRTGRHVPMTTMLQVADSESAAIAERDKLAAINAELMAALELALASAVPLDSRIASAMAGDDVIEKWADWVMKARAALAKANKPHQSNDKEC